MKQDEQSALEDIRRRAERMERSRRRPDHRPLRGLSAFGVVGWSVAIPTAGGALLGLWLERVAPRGFSWPLALMLAGLAIGIVVAGEWIMKQDRRTRDEESAASQQDGNHDLS